MILGYMGGKSQVNKTFFIEVRHSYILESKILLNKYLVEKMPANNEILRTQGTS